MAGPHGAAAIVRGAGDTPPAAFAGQGAGSKLVNKRLFVDAGGPVAFDGMAVEPRGGTAP